MKNNNKRVVRSIALFYQEMAPVPEEGEHDAKPHDSGPIDDLPVPDVFINAESSDSEDDGNDIQGYQMLPQDIEDDENDDGGSDTHSIEDTPSDEIDATQIDEAIRNSGVHTQAGGGTPSYMQVPEIPKQEAHSLVWNQNRGEPKIALDEERTEKIKNVMKKIQLPLSNIPDWAKDIPEDQWKEKIAKIQDKNS